MASIGSSTLSAAFQALQTATSNILALIAETNQAVSQIQGSQAAVANSVNDIAAQQTQNVATIAAQAEQITLNSIAINANTAVDVQQQIALAGLRTDVTVTQTDINTLKQVGGPFESAAGFTILSGTAGSGGLIYTASAAHNWRIDGGVVKYDNAVYGTSANGDLGLWFKPGATGTFWYHKSTGEWYEDTGSATLTFRVTGDPRNPTTFTKSVSNTRIAAGSSNFLVNATLDLFTVTSGGVLQKNAASAYTGAANYGTNTGVVTAVWWEPAGQTGYLWYVKAGNQWYKDNGSGTFTLQPSGDPASPAVFAESGDNTTITKTSGTFLYDANLYRWAIVTDFSGTPAGSTSLVVRAPPYTGADVWPNSSIVPPTDQGNSDVQSAFYFGHAVYQINAAGKIYKVVLTPPSTFVGTGPVADPRSAGLPDIAAAGKPGGVIQFGGVTTTELANFNTYCGWWRVTADTTADSAPLWNGGTFTDTITKCMGTGKICFLITYFAYGADVTNYSDPTTVNTTKLNNYINTYIPAMIAGARARFPNSQNQLVWQVLNEPHMRQDLLRGTWLPAIITAIRNAEIAQGEPPHYIAVMASDAPTAGGHQDWDIGLINQAPYADTRVIYGFHWYTPGSYTFQGTSQGPAARTVSYPSGSDVATLNSRFDAVRNYKNTNNVSILLDEYNCAGFEPGSSGPGFRPMPLMQSRFMKDITDGAKSRGFIVGPFGIQDYNSFHPLVDNARPNRVIAANLITRDFGDGLGPVPIVWG